jgi:hypothetical protein
MKLINIILLTLITICVQAQELPTQVTKILRNMELEIARERVKAVKDLEDELTRAMKAGKLDDAIAIRKIIQEQTDLVPKTEEEVGKVVNLRKMAGERKVSGHDDYWMFKADGTFVSSWGGNGKWEMKDTDIFIYCQNGVVLECTYQSDDVWIEKKKNNIWTLVK